MKTVPASVLVAMGLAGLVAVGIVSLITGLPAPEGDLLLVLVPPWVSADEVVLAAGGQIAAPISAPLSTFATGTTPARLLAAGALWVADGRLAARLCGLE